MPAEGRPRGIFVTGTDTGVGKTVVAAALIRFLRERDMNVGAMKPVETGVDDPAVLGPDASLLQWAAGSEDEPDLISPYRLKAPLAPSIAAEREKRRIDYTHLVDCYHTLTARHEFLVVEGAGGLMVPLSGGLLMADLARDLGLPLLVVCRSGLGTINHTLLTIHAARTMDIPVAGFVINGMPETPDTAEETAPHALSSLASADLLGVLPRIEGDETDKVEALATAIDHLPTLPWLLGALGI